MAGVGINMKFVKFAVIAIILLTVLVWILVAVVGITIGVGTVFLFEPAHVIGLFLAAMLVLGGVYVFWKGLAPGYWRFIVPGVMLVIAYLFATGSVSV